MGARLPDRLYNFKYYHFICLYLLCIYELILGYIYAQCVRPGKQLGGSPCCASHLQSGKMCINLGQVLAISEDISASLQLVRQPVFLNLDNED